MIHSAQQDRDASIHQAQTNAAHEVGARDQMLNSADHALRDREHSISIIRPLRRIQLHVNETLRRSSFERSHRHGGQVRHRR